MSKYTEGPWSIGKVIDNSFEPIHHRVMSNDGVKIVAKCYYGVDNSEREANARLIASSPKLLKACKDVIKYHMENDSGEGELFGLDIVTACIEAVAEAEER